MWSVLSGVIPCLADAADPFVLKRLEFVYLWYNPALGQFGEYEVISEGNLPASPSGTWNLEEIVNAQTGGGAWSEVPWRLSGTVNYSFPALVPYPPPDEAAYKATVEITGNLFDPQAPNPSPPPLRIETRISLAPASWGPGPPSPPSWVNTSTWPNWRRDFYWSWYGSGPPTLTSSFATTLPGESVQVTSSWNDHVINSSGSYFRAPNIVLEWYARKGGSSSLGDSARYRVVHIYSTYDQEPPPIQVDTLTDEDDGDHSPGDQSLREALKRAGQLTTAVQIPVTVSGTITLDSALQINGTNTNWITLAPGAGRVSLDGAGSSRILYIEADQKLAASDLDFVNGKWDESGGAVLNSGELNLTDCYFENNSAGIVSGSGSFGVGGAIFNFGPGSRLKVRDSFFRSNSAATHGKHLAIAPGTQADVTNSVFITNSKERELIFNRGVCRLKHCTLVSMFGWDLVVASEESGAYTGLSHCALGPLRYYGLFNTRGPVTSEGFNAIQNPGPEFTPLGTDIVNESLYMSVTRSGGVSLLALSPCINRGNPLFDPADFSPPLDRDVLGRSRVIGTIDIGALELREDLSYLAQALLNPNGDMNLNGVPDIVDALTGVDPTQDVPAEPVLEVSPDPGLPPSLFAPLESGPPGTVLAEVRIDERVVGAEATLQSSTDLQTWTDRATYRPLGLGLGYARTAHNGTVLRDHTRSGFGWKIREEVPVSTSGRVFTRLTAAPLE